MVKAKVLSTNLISVALVNFQIKGGQSLALHKARLHSLLAQAKAQGVQFVLLPELPLS